MRERRHDGRDARARRRTIDHDVEHHDHDARRATSPGRTEPQENALAPVDQLLTDVTTATDGCVDSVTFTFRPSSAPAPSYRVEYADGPFTDSAGAR